MKSLEQKPKCVLSSETNIYYLASTAPRCFLKWRCHKICWSLDLHKPKRRIKATGRDLYNHYKLKAFVQFKTFLIHRISYDYVTFLGVNWYLFSASEAPVVATAYFRYTSCRSSLPPDVVAATCLRDITSLWFVPLCVPANNELDLFSGDHVSEVVVLAGFCMAAPHWE